MLRMLCCEFCMMSAMRVPLWSSKGEYQCGECAFMSPVSIVLSNVFM